MDRPGKPAERAERGPRGGASLNGFNSEMARMALWPTQLLLLWQGEALRAVASATAEWMARRQEETEAALQAVQRLCSCQHADDAAKIQREWASEEAKRLESDLYSLTKPALFWPQLTAWGHTNAHGKRAA